VVVVDDAAPADDARPHELKHAARAVEDPAALDGEQPLVAVRGEEVDVAPLDVERQAAEALDRVDAEEHATLLAQAPDRVEVGAHAAPELDRGEREQAGARARERLGDALDREPPAVAAQEHGLHAAVGELPPGIDVRRVLEVAAHDLVAASPLEPASD